MSTTLARTPGPCPTPDDLSDERARWAASWLGDAARHPLFRMEVSNGAGWTVHPFADPDGHMPAAHVAEALALMEPRATVLRTERAVTAAPSSGIPAVRIRWTAVPGARTLAPGEPIDWAATFTGDGWEPALGASGARHAWRMYVTHARTSAIQALVAAGDCGELSFTVDAAGVIKLYGADGATIRLTPDH